MSVWSVTNRKRAINNWFLIVFFVISSGGTLVVSTSAVAATCKSNVVSRQIQARFINLGKQRARANWRKKVRKKYGWKYRDWSKAKRKNYQIEVRGQDYLLYKIRAYGTPCK